MSEISINFGNEKFYVAYKRKENKSWKKKWDPNELKSTLTF